jgi:hypothetical protein
VRDWRKWPALAQAPEEKRTLGCLRGVYGKVHGQASEYRWIGTTDGWPDGFENKISLGSEDKGDKKFPFWFPDENLVCAGCCYPSEAIDATGRKTPIEKQMLLWRVDPGFPPLAAGFLMLDEARQFDKSVWWDYREGNEWENPEYRLRLDPYPIEYDPDRVAELISCGLEELRQLDPTGLSSFYASLAAGVSGAALKAEDKLTGAGLAALLLPLPADRKLALAGWVPQERFPDSKVLERWHGLVCAPTLAGIKDRSLGDESRVEGERLAEMIRTGPSSESHASREPEPLCPVLKTPAADEVVPIRETAPTESVMCPEKSREIEVEPTSKPKWVPEVRRPFTSSGLAADYETALLQWYEFADSEDRWIDLSTVPYKGPLEVPTDVISKALKDLCEYINGQQRSPDSVFNMEKRSQQMSLKRELCLAWLFALGPNSAWSTSNLQEFERVAPVALAITWDMQEWNRKASLDDRVIGVAVEKSLGILPNLESSIRAWKKGEVALRNLVSPRNQNTWPCPAAYGVRSRE